MKNRSNKDKGTVKLLVPKSPEFRLSERIRLKINVNIFSYYVGGKIILKKIDELITDIIKPILKPSEIELLKFKYYVLSDYYDELFYLLDFSTLITDDTEFWDEYFKYLNGIYSSKTESSYLKVSKRFARLQNNKLLSLYPFLKEKEDFGGTIISALRYFDFVDGIEKTTKNKIDRARLYAPNRRYSIEMYQKYHYFVVVQGYKQYPAAEKVFKECLPASELEAIDDLPKKIESFIRQAARTKI